MQLAFFPDSTGKYGTKYVIENGVFHCNPMTFLPGQITLLDTTSQFRKGNFFSGSSDPENIIQ